MKLRSKELQCAQRGTTGRPPAAVGFRLHNTQYWTRVCFLLVFFFSTFSGRLREEDCTYMYTKNSWLQGLSRRGLIGLRSFGTCCGVVEHGSHGERSVPHCYDSRNASSNGVFRVLYRPRIKSGPKVETK